MSGEFLDLFHCFSVGIEADAAGLFVGGSGSIGIAMDTYGSAVGYTSSCSAAWGMHSGGGVALEVGIWVTHKPKNLGGKANVFGVSGAEKVGGGIQLIFSGPGWKFLGIQLSVPIAGYSIEVFSYGKSKTGIF